MNFFLFFSRLRVGVVEMRWGNLGEGGEESVLRRLRSDRDLEHCLLRNSSLLQLLHQNETYTGPKTEHTIRPENKSKHYYVFKFKSSKNTQFCKNATVFVRKTIFVVTRMAGLVGSFLRPFHPWSGKKLGWPFWYIFNAILLSENCAYEVCIW